ncbi:MAG TPA: GntR family transcriptional regulator [Acidobacteriota bacterium]|nr:GntR family transcriptional regulator [Acidobacteriota bacterium]
MLLNITDLSQEPLQSQIARLVRAKILNGDLEAADSLPSIRELARRNQVSVITVQRAYESLVREGLIHARRGKGFFVADLKSESKRRMSLSRLKDELAPAVKVARHEGLTDEEIEKALREVLERED